MMQEGFDQKYSKNHTDRFNKTLRVLKEFAEPKSKIIDIGPDNPFAKIMRNEGYEVINTPEGVDLDYHDDLDVIKNRDFDLATSFEVFEHMVNPFGVLKNLGTDLLITSVPLKLWFVNAYWNEDDPYDRHYHEFEPRQFNMLLHKSGWEIIYSEQWASKSFKIGIRPILRMFTPRYYLVVAKRTANS